MNLLHSHFIPSHYNSLSYQIQLHKSSSPPSVQSRLFRWPWTVLSAPFVCMESSTHVLRSFQILQWPMFVLLLLIFCWRFSDLHDVCAASLNVVDNFCTTISSCHRRFRFRFTFLPISWCYRARFCGIRIFRSAGIEYVENAIIELLSIATECRAYGEQSLENFAEISWCHHSSLLFCYLRFCTGFFGAFLISILHGDLEQAHHRSCCAMTFIIPHCSYCLHLWVARFVY